MLNISQKDTILVSYILQKSGYYENTDKRLDNVVNKVVEIYE